MEITYKSLNFIFYTAFKFSLADVYKCFVPKGVEGAETIIMRNKIRGNLISLRNRTEIVY